MSAHSATDFDGFRDVRDALGAVRDVQGEYAQFFSGVFSRLESVSNAAKARRESGDRQLEDFRREQQSWQQQRAMLERELEAVRSRAAELSEALAQQKRDAERQHSEWVGELRRMRRALQQIAHRPAEHVEESADTAASASASRPRAVKAANRADPVLDSVMAQFEILQNDAARRRKSH